MSINFGWNTNEEIGMNPKITTGGSHHRLPGLVRVIGPRMGATAISSTPPAGCQIFPTKNLCDMAQKEMKINTRGGNIILQNAKS